MAPGCHVVGGCHAGGGVGCYGDVGVAGTDGCNLIKIYIVQNKKYLTNIIIK